MDTILVLNGYLCLGYQTRILNNICIDNEKNCQRKLVGVIIIRVDDYWEILIKLCGINIEINGSKGTEMTGCQA